MSYEVMGLWGYEREGYEREGYEVITLLYYSAKDSAAQ